MRRDNYVHGDHNVICDRSGFKIKFSDSRKEWTGLRVDKRFWDPRHPQDKIRSVRDDQSVTDPRPDQEPIFVSTNQVQPGDL